MTITGIIPAAGTGSRWGGYYKELLPTGHNEHLIDRAVLTCRVGGAERVVIITTPEKISAHASHFRYRDSDIIFKIQDGVNDIYSAIESSFSWNTETNLFVMPDTYIPLGTFRSINNAPFQLGVHSTTMPERFGIINYESKEVLNKQPLKDGVYDAWGALVWSLDVAKLWNKNEPLSYTDAINLAIRRFGLSTFKMEFYHDMAEFADYRRLLGEIYESIL